jgi:putative transposase
MTFTIGIRSGTRVTFPFGAFRYKEPLDHGHLFASEADGSAKFVSDEDLARLYVERKVKIVGFRQPNAHALFADLGPLESLDPWEQTRAWFVRAWDKDPCSISHAAMKAFIERCAPAARKDGVAVMPSSGSVMLWIRERGEMDFRPTKAMRTRTGKAPRVSKFHPFVERAMASCVAWFWSHESYDKTDAYARLFRMIRLVNAWGAKRFAAWRPIAAPTYETLRQRIDKVEQSATHKAKFGGRRAQQHFGGTAPITASHIREKVMIDSTTVDGWCGFREEALVLLGRPTVYAAVDVRSRMTLKHLWFGPPSLEGIMAMIKKVVIAWGKVESIIVDNTWEHRSPSFEEAMRSAGINLVWAPIRRPEYKAVVEVTFNTINRGLFHKLMGGSVPFPVHLMRRFQLDPAKTTSLTVEELDDQLGHLLDEVYPIRIHKGIGEKPGLVWRRETAERKFHMIEDLDALLVHFGQMQVATLSREGVTLRDGLRFFDRAAVTGLLDDLARFTPHRQRRAFSAKAKVKVVVDPSDISQCIIWNPKTNRPVTLGNVHVRFGKECATRWEYQQVAAWADEENLAFSTDEERLAALWKLRALISSMAPEELKKARKRHFALLKTLKEEPVGDRVVDAVDDDYATDGKPKSGPKEPAAAKSGIPNLIAATIAEGDALPRKGVRRGGAKSIAKQKQTVALNRETARLEQTAQEAARQAAEAENARKTARKSPFKSASDVFAAIGDDVLDADWVKGGAAKKRKDGK